MGVRKGAQKSAMGISVVAWPLSTGDRLVDRRDCAERAVSFLDPERKLHLFARTCADTVTHWSAGCGRNKKIGRAGQQAFTS